MMAAATSSLDRPLTLADMVEDSVRARPDAVAVILDDVSVTYGALWRSAERRARQMLALGVSAGDHVGVLLPNCHEYLEILLGAALIGATVVPMNMRYKVRELRHLIVDSAMVVLFTQSGVEEVVEFVPLLIDALPGLDRASDPAALKLGTAPALRAIVALDDAPAYLLQEAQIPHHSGDLPARPGAQDQLLLMYTSGTTADPKGCLVPHRAIGSNAWAIIDIFALRDDDMWWCPLPMFHIGGILFGITMLAVGGCYAGMTHFTAAGAIDMIERAPPTIFYPLFPTITLPIIDHPRFATLDHGRMRFMVNLAPPDLQRKIQAAVPHAPLLGAFGMTETCGTVCYGSPADDAETRYVTCGRPLPGWEIRITDAETHAPLATGQRGEIAVRGVGLFGGYLNAPELTARQHLDDGFFLTGDIGSLDEAGRLTFHGRFKDQLKVGGENVSALEVESLLATHPAVGLAQVVGVGDAKYGEVPAAFIELREGAVATEQEVIDFCRGKIARFKIPRHVRFVTEWPMSATKIVKHRLREQIEQELAGDAARPTETLKQA